MIRAWRLLAVAAVTALLPGCVAAAIPVLAGGAIATSEMRGGRDKAAVSTAAPSPGGAASAVRPIVDPAPAGATVDPMVKVDLAMPAPVPEAYAAFFSYAFAEARPYLPTEDRYSAVLADPGAIRPETRLCEEQPPAVLIDLDEGDVPFDPENFARIPIELAPALSQLRARNLQIIWLSGADSSQTAKIRDLLKRAMLDPAGRDLIALPAPDERKQVVRQKLGQDFCIEAIAGDRRADFDELYDYLIDERSAAALETMIGQGWFLVPPPFETPE